MVLVVEVQHRDLGEFSRGATGTRVVRRFRQADDVGVRVRWQKGHRTVARAVIGIVPKTQNQDHDRLDFVKCSLAIVQVTNLTKRQRAYSPFLATKLLLNN